MAKQVLRSVRVERRNDRKSRRIGDRNLIKKFLTSKFRNARGPGFQLKQFCLISVRKKEPLASINFLRKQGVERQRTRVSLVIGRHVFFVAKRYVKIYLLFFDLSTFFFTANKHGVKGRG